MRKICIIGPASSVHIKKWCQYFIEKEYEVHIISFQDDYISGTILHHLKANVNSQSNDFIKIKYLLYGKKVNKIVKEVNPDMISVHYASSYGMLAALSHINKYCLSVWGSDIFSFPKKSYFHKMLLIYSLKKAKTILSTSNYMAKEIKKYTKKDIIVTPFGVKTEQFLPKKREQKDFFIIGNVKSLKEIYGYDCLIKALSEVVKNNKEMKIKCLIVGDGLEKQNLINISKELKVDKYIEWLGEVENNEVPKIWSTIDVGIIPSIQESFGVTALEAQSCCTPLIISKVEGLLETTIPNKTSLVVDVNDYRKIAEYIEYLFNNKERIETMGKAGREYVKQYFDYYKCFERIERILKNEFAQ